MTKGKGLKTKDKRLRTKGERLGISSSFALGIGAASFASGSWRRRRMLEAEAGGEKRYSGKPDGGAGTPRLAFSYQRTAISS